MGIRNPKRNELLRLQAKTLDGQLENILTAGLNCSRFEAKAVIQAAQEVYFPFRDQAASSAPPGRVTLLTVSAEEPSGKPIAECAQQAVCLTLHRGEPDDRLLQARGPTAFRRERIPDLCQQAFSQGGLLTREDLAYRIFFVGTRTISRDLAWWRHNHPQVPLPLRSTVQDIGPLLTHRVEIVRLALEGQTTSEIVRIMRHSPSAITNYVGTFTRCAQLAEQKLQLGQIAFLLRRGPSLIRQYLALLDRCRTDANLGYHLQQLLQLGQAAGEKKGNRGRPHARQA